jgi:hypothetical protein
MSAGLVTDTAEKHKQSAAMVVSIREVMEVISKVEKIANLGVKLGIPS